MAKLRSRYFETNESYFVWYNPRRYLIKVYSVNRTKNNKIKVNYWLVKELEMEKQNDCN